MAEMVVVAKGKVNAGVKTSYFRLERTRRTQRNGPPYCESAAHHEDVKYGRGRSGDECVAGRIRRWKTLQVDSTPEGIRQAHGTGWRAVKSKGKIVEDVPLPHAKRRK